jgi:hypothetical protein
MGLSYLVNPQLHGPTQTCRQGRVSYYSSMNYQRELLENLLYHWLDTRKDSGPANI